MLSLESNNSINIVGESIGLIVGGRVSVGSSATIDGIAASRGGVVTRAGRLMVVVSSVGSSNGGASVGSVVARAVVMSGSWGSESTAGSRNSSNLRVAGSGGSVGLSALPELHTGTLGVSVRRARAKALLLLVVAHEEDLEQGTEQEEDGGNDSDGKAGSVELANGTKRGRVGNLVAAAVGTKSLFGPSRTIAKRSLDISRAFGGTVTSQDGNGNHGTAAEDVEEYAKNSEDCLSSG